MGTFAELRPFTREEAAEALRTIEETKGLLGSVPYRDAKLIESNLRALEEMVEDIFPGGFQSVCEVCGVPMGADEISVTDNENILYFCAPCMEEDHRPKDTADA
ncbi:hypothetical protein CFBP5507_06170 [Agrobacterium salinitolerans]|uniref:Uncharacterized protein n=1 Tax=Agrobacterium salinitolerans TaxID=1183413 RepID=A0A4Z1R676_9HYPH|nr:hypothetical protein [Agrobacterium salinitolerans]UYZ08585.1 hypothetical protein CFBP5507_06170 [Agrobacterium salinitolerans]